jgi:hypothetical protein
MQLADVHTKEIQEATRLALGHGADLKGLEFAHELSMNELAMRPWKTFFDTLVASKVLEHPLFELSTAQHTRPCIQCFPSERNEPPPVLYRF